MCVKRWTESAEEASSGAELVVEAILEDLQVRSFEALVDVVVVAVDGGGVVVEAILEVLRFLLSLMMVVLMLLLLMVMVLLLRPSLKTSR